MKVFLIIKSQIMLFLLHYKMQDFHVCGGSWEAHLPSFHVAIIVTSRVRLVHPVHVSDKGDWLWMAVRIRVVVNAVFAAHVIAMELWLLLQLVFCHLNFCNFLTVIVVIIVRVRLIFHHVVVDVLDVILREGVWLESFCHQGIVIGAILTVAGISLWQVLQFVCRDFVTLFKVCPSILEPDLVGEECVSNGLI